MVCGSGTNTLRLVVVVVMGGRIGSERDEELVEGEAEPARVSGETGRSGWALPAEAGRFSWKAVNARRLSSSLFARAAAASKFGALVWLAAWARVSKESDPLFDPDPNV